MILISRLYELFLFLRVECTNETFAFPQGDQLFIINFLEHVNGKIYVLGMSGNGTWVAFPDCFEYCPVLDKWTRLPSMPKSQARGSSALGVKGSTIYLAGGLTSLSYTTGDQFSVATVTSYDVVTKEWLVLPDLPEGRGHVGGAVVDDTFYVVGGRVNGVTNVRNTTFALDLKAAALGRGKWMELAHMPTARGGLATSHLDGVIYTFGGEGNITFIPNGVYNETQAYDIKANKWIKYPVMPVPRHGTQAVAVGRCNYVPGGGWHTGTGPMNTTDAFCI